jgi:demethylmenaquinone methyltransferase/2-methoxy-6-polyprenyl-1,4-benzoquinol methylase
MLQTAQLRLAQQGCFTPRYYRATPVTLLNLVAEDLSFFTNDSVDGLSCAFGWRNMSDKQKAVSEMSRILKPKSLCHILEFTPPTTSLPMRLYDKYLSVFLPLIGEIAYADRKSYEYLAQSIKDFWTPQECVAALEHAGLTQIKTVSVFGGIAHYYRGEKP